MTCEHTPVENKFKVFFNFLKTLFWLETIVNGSSSATELTNISDYLLLVYQTALFEPLNNCRQEKGILFLLLALFSENIKDDRLRKGITPT